MDKKSKRFWLWNYIVGAISFVPLSVAGLFPWWFDAFVVMPLQLGVLVALAWDYAIQNRDRFELGGPCVHCGGDLFFHVLEDETRCGYCKCRNPREACDCMGYQPARRWLDDVGIEDRSEARDLGVTK